MKATNRRKVLAILAGGLVLGVGAAVTLAAWNDSEFAQGTFTAGSFNLEGATENVDASYADHDTVGTAETLEFTMPLAGNMAPADVVYAPFFVRLDATTTSPATLVAAGVTSQSGASNNDANLSYEVYAIDAAAACDASATGGTLLATGTDLTDFAASNSVALAVGTPPTTAGAPAQLCFIVTAEATLDPGLASTVTWEFEATSN